MSTFNLLSPGARLEEDQGRGQLQESLDLISFALNRLQTEMASVKEADDIVRASPLLAFPVPQGPIQAEGDRIPVGTIVLGGGGSVPAGYLECNGSAVSRTTYAALFTAISTTYGPGDGSTTFNLPDFRGRALLGEGQGSGLTNRTRGQTGGVETHALSAGELAAHTHDLGNHTHDLGNHTHDRGNHAHQMAHTHTTQITYYDTAGGGAAGPGIFGTLGTNLIQRSTSPSSSQPSTSVTSTDGSGNTGTPSTNTSGTPSTNTTSSAGSGSAHQNMSPWAVAKYFIRYVEQDPSLEQALAMTWGPVPANVDLPTIDVFPSAVANSLVEFVDSTLRPEAITSIEASSGAASGTDTVTVVGAYRVPYNFRAWKPEGLKIRTKIEGSGFGSNVTVALKVHDPVTTASALSTTPSRSTSGDASYVYMQLTAADLEADWKPGYTLKFTLTFTIPKTFTSIKLKMGMLEAHWR